MEYEAAKNKLYSLVDRSKTDKQVVITSIDMQENGDYEYYTFTIVKPKTGTNLDDL